MASRSWEDSSAYALKYSVLREGVDGTRVQKLRTRSAQLTFDLSSSRLTKDVCP